MSGPKPQYENLPVLQFSSMRNGGATADGVTNDTAASQRIILTAASTSRIVYLMRVPTRSLVRSMSRQTQRSSEKASRSSCQAETSSRHQPPSTGHPCRSSRRVWYRRVVRDDHQHSGCSGWGYSRRMEYCFSWQTFWHVGCAYPHRRFRRLQSTSRSMSDHSCGQDSPSSHRPHDVSQPSC